MAIHFNGFARFIATACVAIIATGAASWMAFGKSSVSREQVQIMITHDMKPIEQSLARLELQLTKMDGKQNVIIERMTETATKVNMLLRQDE